jgi:hypothetical protein
MHATSRVSEHWCLSRVESRVHMRHQISVRAVHRALNFECCPLPPPATAALPRLGLLIPDPRPRLNPGPLYGFPPRPHTFTAIDELLATLSCVGRAAPLPNGSRFCIFKKAVERLWDDRASVNVC